MERGGREAERVWVSGQLADERLQRGGEQEWERSGLTGKAGETDVCVDFQEKHKTKINSDSENRKNVRSRRR